MVALAVVLTVAGALSPGVVFSLLVAGVGLAAGGLLADGGGRRALGLLGGATIGAFVLLAPWSIDLVVPGAGAERLAAAPVAASRALGFGALLRFDTGPMGSGLIGWAFVVVAALPLVVGHEWRLSWAARCWGVALAGWLVAWTGGRGWLPVPVPAPEVMLAPVAVALALAAGLGLIAFRVDVPAYRFGWRQFASTTAAIAVAAGVLPVLAGAVDGRWHLPSRDYRAQLSWMPDHRQEGAFRVLWVGDPEALPLQGWRLGNGVAYGLSDGGVPDATALWPASSSGATGLVGAALRSARDGDTTRLGRRLAPTAVRYVVVVDRAAPTSKAPRLGRLPTDVVAGLSAQLDLKLVSTDQDQLVYENAAWGPGRSRLAIAGDTTDTKVTAADIAPGAPALRTQKGPLHFDGRVEPGDTVFLSQAASAGWKLTVDGHRVPRRRALGWANVFSVPRNRNGAASLVYQVAPLRIALALGEIALWALAIRYLLRHRRRRST
jgi:hypothetical protein